jgi:hypothetical protein
MSGGGEVAHVRPDLSDDHRSGDRADAGDFIEPVDRGGERDKVVAGPALDRGDVSVDRVDPTQHPREEERVVIGEMPGEGLLQKGDLGAHPGPR